jgi:hypothetical protein
MAFLTVNLGNGAFKNKDDFVNAIDNFGFIKGSTVLKTPQASVDFTKATNTI